MSLELDVTMATSFLQTCFSKFVIFVFPLIKINFNSTIVTSFRVFLNCFIDFEYFSVIFGGFLMFRKNFEIQDGGSKMAAVLTS